MAIEGLTSHYNDKANWTAFHALSEEQCEIVIENALKIIEEIGLKSNPAICEHFKNIGTVEGDIVKLPRQVIIDSINSAPCHIDSYDRKGNKVIDLGGSNSYYGMGPTNPFFYDFETRERRRAVLADCAAAAKVADALPEFDFLMSLSDIADKPAELNDLWTVRAMLENSTKPIVGLPLNVTTLEEVAELVAAAHGGWDKFYEKPSWVLLNGETSTPLCTEEVENTAKIFFAADKNIPQCNISYIQLGSVAPVVLASAIELAIAENLFLLAISQTYKPGAPAFCSLISGTFDMRTTRTCYGTPEHCLCEAAGADVFHYLDLPTLGTGGAVSSKFVDEQLAIEQSMTILMSGLDGGNLIHNVGFMEDGLVSHLDSLTMANEIIGYSRRIRRGIQFDEETTSIETIAEIGHGGEYMTADQTFDYFEDEVWYPELIDRGSYSKWLAGDQRTFNERLHAKTAHILATHPDVEFAPEVVAEMDRICDAAMKRVGA